MAILYVRSTDGNNADNGSTWALAKATIAGAIAAASAGDTIYVSQAHAETTAAAVTLTFPGTIASPNYVICVNDAAEPPTAVATTATVSTTGANNLTLRGHVYCYGITFSAGSSTSAAVIQLANTTYNRQIFEQCTFALAGANGSSQLSVSVKAIARLVNSQITFSHAGQYIFSDGAFEWDGGSVPSGTTPNYLFYDDTSSRSTNIIVSGVDFSALGTGFDFYRGGGGGSAGTLSVRNCKLPASWAGTLFNTSPAVSGCRGELYNCDSTDTNYRIWIEDAYGALTQETTLVRTGGATDGTTALAWKIVTTTRCNTASGLFPSAEIVRWNETTGSALTATVEILHDSATALTDAEVWLEVMYLGTSGVPLGTWTSDRAADILATPADQADSSATWTTTGMTNPNTQKLSVTITPREIGYIHARVVVAKASTTLYVCPVITLA